MSSFSSYKYGSSKRRRGVLFQISFLLNPTHTSESSFCMLKTIIIAYKSATHIQTFTSNFSKELWFTPGNHCSKTKSVNLRIMSDLLFFLRLVTCRVYCWYGLSKFLICPMMKRFIIQNNDIIYQTNLSGLRRDTCTFENTPILITGFLWENREFVDCSILTVAGFLVVLFPALYPWMAKSKMTHIC